MNLWQILVFATVTVLVFFVLAIIGLAIYMTYREQVYKLRMKYGPKTDAEVEQRANELLDELLANRTASNLPSDTAQTRERREGGHESLP